MTGEISLLGLVKPIGGVKAKISAAVKGGANKVIIPQDNYDESLEEIEGIKICPVSHFKEVISIALEEGESTVKNSKEILSAKGNNMIET